MPPAPDLTRRPRARIAFGDADMVRLRDLYYDTAVPMVKVAQAFGVSASTLYHWIADMDWPRRDDVVTDGGYPDRVLANAPDPENHFYAVPKVVE